MGNAELPVLFGFLDKQLPRQMSQLALGLAGKCELQGSCIVTKEDQTRKQWSISAQSQEEP